MEPSHPLRKDAQLSYGQTTVSTYGQQGTLPCTFWRLMRLGLIPHCPQLSCWLVPWCLSSNRFIRGINRSERKVVPWHSHLVAILDSPKNFKSSNLTTAVVNTPISNTPKTGIEVAETPIQIRIARQASLRPHTEYHMIATTSAVGIHTVKPRILQGARQLKFATYNVIDFLPLQTFHILTFNFSAQAMHISQHMLVEYALGPSLSMMTASLTLHRHLHNRNPREFGSFRVTRKIVW